MVIEKQERLDDPTPGVPLKFPSFLTTPPGNYSLLCVKRFEPLRAMAGIFLSNTAALK
jgi:hypothetical protein